MTDIKSLIKKRASIKAKLTLFSTYLNVVKSCEKLSETQLIEIEQRLNAFETLYEKYDTLQIHLEEAVDEPSEQYAERETFETCYYAVFFARTRLDCYVISKVSSSIPSTYVHKDNISLPSNIVLADPNFYTPSSIDILVGAEIFWGIIGMNRITLGNYCGKVLALCSLSFKPRRPRFAWTQGRQTTFVFVVVVRTSISS
ncbi:hypothetical protein SFRURICE_021513 [Spodoptera frugiperda]|nr:hypothetical protein SFRURICE_021513 [Spodoptera frugiperda]